MEQIRDGVLTLLITGVHVSVQYVHDVAMLIKTAVHIIIKLHISFYFAELDDLYVPHIIFYIQNA